MEERELHWKLASWKLHWQGEIPWLVRQAVIKSIHYLTWGLKKVLPSHAGQVDPHMSMGKGSGKVLYLPTTVTLAQGKQNCRYLS